MPRSAPVVASVLAACLLAASCGGPEFSSKLASYEVVKAKQVSLGDGGRISVGSDDGERFAMQWRDPDGARWTKPETVVEGSNLEASRVTIESRRTTAVVGFSWYAADDDERENFARQDAAVCRDLSCDVAKDVQGAPQIDDKGEFAVVGAAEDSLSFRTWRQGDDGWDTITVTGPPHGESFKDSFDVLLLADASFATVIGSLDNGSCSYELWQSQPHEGKLAKVARTKPRVQGSCTAESLETRGRMVTFYDRATDQKISFTRDGSRWTNDQVENGPVPINAESGLPMSLTNLRGGGGSVAVGSPDGRAIIVQHRPQGERSWSPPITVASASKGQECQSVDAVTTIKTSDVMYLVHCWPQGSAWGTKHDDTPVPTSGFALASADGRRWVTEPLERPAYEPQFQTPETLLLARGGDQSVVWRPGAKAFQKIRLPLAHPTVDGLAISGDTAIRVTGNPDKSKACRPTWSVAAVSAESWGSKHQMGPTPDWIDGPTACYGVVMDTANRAGVGEAGRTFRVAAVVGNGSIDGVLTRTGKGWSFTAH